MLFNPVCLLKPGQLILLQVRVRFGQLCLCALFVFIIMTGEPRHDSLPDLPFM